MCDTIKEKRKRFDILRNDRVERLKRYTYKKQGGGTVVKGVRAQPKFFELLDEAASMELTTRNQLICQVMTAYCKEVLNNGEVASRSENEDE